MRAMLGGWIDAVRMVGSEFSSYWYLAVAALAIALAIFKIPLRPRVASFASLSGRELTKETVEHLLKDILQEEGRQSITIEQIQRRVAEHFDVRLADMTSKRRPASIAFPRQVAMFLARELTKASLNEIGDAFGGRDHGTVLQACKLVKKRMTEQDNIRQTISYIDSSLQR